MKILKCILVVLTALIIINAIQPKVEAATLSFDNMKSSVSNVKSYTFTDKSKKQYITMDIQLNNITRSEAQKILEEKISSMRNQAQETEQEFTIRNLENLQIDGYEV